MTARFRSKSIADLVVALGLVVSSIHAVAAAPQSPAAASTAGATAMPTVIPAPAVPAEYVIGPEDVLSIVYWRDKDMTGDVSVRPDGKISLPLLNDIQAAGMTPAQLRVQLIEASKPFFEDPSVTIVVKQMNSRKVFITGEVEKPGPYPLVGPTTVLQLISLAGGLRDYANSKNILILRTENGFPKGYSFNYKDVVSRKNLRQNIELRPGDTVVVP